MLTRHARKVTAEDARYWEDYYSEYYSERAEEYAREYMYDKYGEDRMAEFDADYW